MTQGEKQNSEMVAPVTGITLRNDVIEIVEHAQGGAEKVDKPRDSNLVSSCLVDTLSQYSLHRGEIIVYSRNTINAYSLLSHEWWVPLIKFIVGPTIYVRGGSMHL